MKILLFWSSLFGVSCVLCDIISDVTNDVGLSNVEGIIAAYGDFNSDKTTDIFVISNRETKLSLYLWQVKKLKFEKSGDVDLTVGSDSNIVGIALADFNGDGSMDVLLSTKKKSSTETFVEVYFGDRRKLKKGNLDAKMLDQPLVMDVNGDLFPDLFGAKEDGTRSYWLYVPNSGFHLQPQADNYTTLAVPNTNAFVDVTGDMHPDLLVKSKSGSNNELMLERWEQKQDKQDFSLVHTFVIKIPDDPKLYGQMSYADIDGDGHLEMLLPVCGSNDCADSRLYVHHFNGENDNGNLSLLINNKNHDWKFPVDQMQVNAKHPFTLRFGDVDSNGKVDAVTVLQKKTGDRKFISYLMNSPCADDRQSGCSGSRTFTVHELENHSANLPLTVSFLDVFENGALDFVVTCQNAARADTFYTKILKNEFNLDTAFLKVAVLSGLKNTASYGANQVGAMIGMTTTNTDGNRIHAKGVQISQTAYYALQLPYIVFGLGRSPNFVEEIIVGLPKGPQKVDRVKSWTAIIPNAQVIVIPYPKDKPSEWVTKLLVTPSKLLLQTGGVLIGTCLLIAGIILILHIKEKKEDEREKRKESHKFHFDAL
ncbi:T-cell immunomodulatory protein-like isoform X1 [Hydractinia symbiolongicarpus]|uniref:T-cell immunomodulatory protein-like isoform X1 n=1 Tax=Hydractinia symbiolongicarpus TaxID=13093 RepID=UPI00254E1743|nr:T-cell immunomodulatory protein-like isoform X1 [Hydractinia symbiolongicarpus]